MVKGTRKHGVLFGLFSDVRKSEMSDLFVDRDKLRTHKNLPKKRINSKLVSVAFQDDRGTEMKETLTESALLTLQHLHVRCPVFSMLLI